MACVEEIQIVVAHRERATLRVGDVFLKVDADQARTDVEVEAMALAPVPTPEILWRRPPVLALAALSARHLVAWRSRRPRRRRRGQRQVPQYARCTAHGCRHGPAAPSTSWSPDSLTSAIGSSPTTSCLPTWSAEPAAGRDRAPTVDTGVHPRRPPDHPRLCRG